MDYGTGSGVLATAAAVLGAEHVTAIDIDVEILVHARQNFLVGGWLTHSCARGGGGVLMFSVP